MSEIEKNMKNITKIEADNPNPDIFSENIEGEKGAPTELENPEFRVKAATLKGNGSLHIQLGHPQPSKVWKFMEQKFGTPFSQTNSDRVLRKYGAAFNIPTANGSIDQHEMQELGHRLIEAGALVTSFASAANDYVTMKFVGVVDGKDNREKDVKMMEFVVGDDEQLFVAFSHLDVLSKTDNENYPCVRQECLLALLVDEFTGVDA